VTTYDLTRRIESGMPVYPGDPPTSVAAHATYEADRYRGSTLELGSHAGTHVDAPSHTERDGRTLDEFPVDAFRFRARRVDCRDVGDREAITRSELPDAGSLRPETDCLVLWTGFADYWGSDRYRDHPYLDPDAAEWCGERGLSVAVDCFSPDPTPPASGDRGAEEPAGVPAHHALLGAGSLIVENLTGLNAPPERFRLDALPVRVDADGAPVRAVAVVE
jgi:kynurenine formamidase